jgi:hypothetical protein
VDEYSDLTIGHSSALKIAAARDLASSAGIRGGGAAQVTGKPQRHHNGIVKCSHLTQMFGASLVFLHTNEQLCSRLDKLVTNRVSNQARRRVYVKLAHGGRSMRLRRFYAEV